MRRLSRKPASDASGVDGEGSWAISYGDMLTLLLAFFILFFSVDPQKAEDSALARSLLATLAPLAAKANVARPFPDSHGDTAAPPVEPELIEQLGAELTQVGHKVVVEFPNISFFESGQVQLTRRGAQVLGEFANLYTPYAGTHMLNIVGFTDERPVRTSTHGARDNLELSALRAVAAQRHLQRIGIPLDRMRLGGHGVKRMQTLENSADAVETAEKLAMARRVILVVEPERQP